MRAIRAFWSAIWDRGVSISLQFSGGDAGNDKCQHKECGVARKVHGRAHRFVEKKTS